MSTEPDKPSLPPVSPKGRRIADVVHGTIELSPLEAELIQTRSFQRLRGVRQLGLADFVFPGANYSRFAHCIGVSYVTARLVDSLAKRYGESAVGDPRIYRAAGLLHDVGHYPFSHAMEDAIADAYSGEFLLSSDDDKTSGVTSVNALNHEDVGVRLITGPTEIHDILSGYGVEPEMLAAIIGHKEAPQLANLISSDLDADRIDYLLRTGAPHRSALRKRRSRLSARHVSS